ncbi:MAG: type II toxin-antitoxin system death-on-curing family toxin [bacterium]|nr:type II toxin-antitoxin system death-on-curing family toxin [bacterium]
MTEFLSLEDALTLVRDLRVGPMRDIGMLDSAIHRPRSIVFGFDAYPALEEKAAVLLESLVQNHALVDGNKRLGWLACVVFLGLNGIDLDAPDDDAYEHVMSIASGESGWESAAARIRIWTGNTAGQASTD